MQEEVSFKTVGNNNWKPYTAGCKQQRPEAKKGNWQAKHVGKPNRKGSKMSGKKR
jgi:hypothetical protein